MNKKVQRKIAMALCAFYLISMIGIALNMHFCSGRFASVQFTKTKSCDRCKETYKSKSSDSCCKDTSVDLKVKDSHEAGFKINIPHDYSVKLFLGPAFLASFHVLQVKFCGLVENKAPPLSTWISLHILHCVFRN